jgi:hypothetical protein
MHLDGDRLWLGATISLQIEPGESRLSSRSGREELHSGNIEWFGGKLLPVPSEPEGAYVRMEL